MNTTKKEVKVGLIGVGLNTDTKQITESGVRLEDVPGISCKQEGNRYVVATTGSGTYTFKVKKNK